MIALTRGEQSFGARFAVTAGHPPGWRSATDVLTGDITALLDAHAANRGTPTAGVAAALFVSEYAGWVFRPLLAAFHCDAVMLNPSPTAFAWRVEDGRLVAVAHDLSPAEAGDADELVAEIVDGHLVRLIDQVRSHVKVSSRTLWGNVAGNLAATYRWMAWRSPASAMYAEEAARQLSVGRLAGLISPAEIEYDGRAWFAPERRTCCLAYQIPDTDYCAPCSLVTPETRRARLTGQIAKFHQENR